MKKITFYSIYILLFTACIYAQGKELTLRQVTIERRSISPQFLIHLNWIKGTDRYSYITDYGSEGKLISGSISTDKKETLLTLTELNSALEGAGIDELRSFPYIDWVDKDNFKFKDGNKLIQYSFQDKSVKILNTVDEKAENVDYSSKDYAAYTIKNNLFLSVGDEQRQVTFDTNEGIVNGQLVARNEFGIYKGTFWSPSSNYLAFYRKDQTMFND